MKKMILLVLFVAAAFAGPACFGSVVFSEMPEDTSGGQDVFLPASGGQETGAQVPPEAGGLIVAGIGAVAYAGYSFYKAKTASAVNSGGAATVAAGKTAGSQVFNTNKLTVSELERGGELFESGLAGESQSVAGVKKDEA